MNLVEQIQQLNTSPRHQEEEYESTSDFLEWFYYNLYRENAFSLYPVLQKVSMEPEYEMMRRLCYLLINQTNTKFIDCETRIKLYENMKRWTINTICKHLGPTQ